MHKKYWLGFLVLFAVNMYAQQKNVRIDWKDVNYQLEENKTVLLPIFQPENFQYLYDKHIIEYADIFPVPVCPAESAGEPLLRWYTHRR